jgi:hypothetical protein
MNIELKETFITQWKKYFADAELPVVFIIVMGTEVLSGLKQKDDRALL